MATRRIKKTGSKIEPKSKKMPEITVTRMFDEMAKLKIQIKELTETYKKFEEICFEEGLSILDQSHYFLGGLRCKYLYPQGIATNPHHCHL